MRSFALWYSTKNESLNKEATVHVNLWEKGENKKKYYFDFGLLIEDILDIESIYLYAPFPLKKEQVKDLGSIISNNRLASAIFNENFTTTDGEPKKLLVNGIEGKPEFFIYSLEINNQVEVSEFKRSKITPGTIIELKVNTINPTKISRYYFRIRLEVNKEVVHLINDEIKGVSFFSNQFTNTEVIDFRLNDIRSCSEELREKFNEGSKFQILAVHYLILRNANDMIIHHGKEINSRMLESDLWKSYIEGTNQNIIAYHIKSKAKKVFDTEMNKLKVSEYVEDFTDLTRFQYQKGTKKILLMYTLGVIVLGAVGGVLGNLLSSIIGL
ncbi:hypothetical protein [Paenibacillus odorifer]|uniref:hypothetical protein n=1 Tax=Paenibacillus odorifer TaxID=189426 RepID=UPI00096F6D36|nr:hypothetical protein [Paenibacillus odorifer]OMD62439.1 hypothetical protein BSK55_00315 [Paenibacillus odorifer]